MPSSSDPFSHSAEGWTVFEMRSTTDRAQLATGSVVRFKSLVTLSSGYLHQDIQYSYDALFRLTEADYNSGATVYTYAFDLAGNLINLNGTTRTYNAANQMTHDGTNSLTYDPSGNLTSDGANSYTWDRANRLLSMGGVSYLYNGDGHRIQQNTLRYLLDLQPGLAQVIGDSSGSRYLHSPRGIHAVNEGADWQYPLTDALGSVRGYAGANSDVLSTINYSPNGVPDTTITGPAFTGEWRSENETQYHRARHLHPELATWLSLDPFEGMQEDSLNLNGYSYSDGNSVNDAVGELIFHNRYNYAGGNPVNRVDPSGLCWRHPGSNNNQKDQCNTAFRTYTESWREAYGDENTWSSEVLAAYRQEGRYWSNLSYNEFVSQWNNPRYSGQANPGAGLQEGANLFLGGAVITGPTPDDLVWLFGALCLYGLSVIAGATAIALPRRQLFDFSLSWDDAGDDARPIPIPYPDDFDSCSSDMPSCSGLEVAGGRYYGFDDALNSLTAEFPNAVERLSEREITNRGHCPGIGSHSQFYDTEYAGSITCCPCCENSIPDVRCFIRWPH